MSAHDQVVSQRSRLGTHRLTVIQPPPQDGIPTDHILSKSSVAVLPPEVNFDPHSEAHDLLGTPSQPLRSSHSPGWVLLPPLSERRPHQGHDCLDDMCRQSGPTK